MLHKQIVRCLIVLTVCAHFPALWSQAVAAEGSDSPKTHVLFDGKDTKGWKMAGPGKFELVDGTLVSSGGMGLFWYDKEFTDCIVSLEYKVNNDQCNSGVFVRFPDPGNDPWVAVKQGH